jgi:hypothetical protein
VRAGGNHPGYPLFDSLNSVCFFPDQGE